MLRSKFRHHGFRVVEFKQRQIHRQPLLPIHFHGQYDQQLAPAADQLLTFLGRHRAVNPSRHAAARFDNGTPVVGVPGSECPALQLKQRACWGGSCS